MPYQKRSILDQELTALGDDILRLASMVDTAIEQAILALKDRDVTLAQTVVAGDDQINQLRYTIEQECLRILATQQPAARDLRTVIAAIHLAVELERIADHAAGIARLVTRLENEPHIDSLHKLPKMSKRARNMVQQGVQAFIEHNVDLAREMIKRDDKLDKQYSKLFRETLEEMRDDDYIRRATYLLWVGHNLERIGDRATNIAERVIFMLTGEFVEITSDADTIE
ncbi:MAG: phosphate transport system regulatory protein PhoU [Chloroflexi bacterium]|nr:MAG: phosphate transport system regulatory protein PhoU [Chloroflexota bacterium]